MSDQTIPQDYLFQLISKNIDQRRTADTRCSDAENEVVKRRKIYDYAMRDLISAENYIIRIHDLQNDSNHAAMEEHIKEWQELVSCRKQALEHDFTMLSRAIVDVQRAEIERTFIYTIANFYSVAFEVRLDNTSLRKIIADAPLVFPNDSSNQEMHLAINYWKKIAEAIRSL
jgi:hypothetical protein